MFKNAIVTIKTQWKRMEGKMKREKNCACQPASQPVSYIFLLYSLISILQSKIYAAPPITVNFSNLTTNKRATTHQTF